MKNLKKYKTFLLLTTILGILIGGVLGYITEKYIAEGSFYVGRRIDPNQAMFFTYEGYYNQQTALSYTNTAVALIESTDVKKLTLEKLDIEVGEETLREFGNIMKVKKSGPQLITVTVKGSSTIRAFELWNSLINSFLETAEKLNKNTDPNLAIQKVSPAPIVRQSLLPLVSLPIAGGMLFLLISVFLVSLKEYLK